MIGEQGLTLSGGQRQRVALARALITDPAILLLDDATSAIDARVEAEIHATLRRVMAGRTTLLIAHRRSTLQLADRIAVLDEGRLVDLGTHDELTERCPLYRLLLAGPGDDAEGVDAGELAYYENEPPGATARRRPRLGRTAGGAGDRADGVTPRLWPGRATARRRVPPGRHGAAGQASAAIGRASASAAAAAAAGRRRPAAPPRLDGGMLAGVPPTPELLAKVAALPPANDEPGRRPGLQPGARPALHAAQAAAAVRRRADRRACSWTASTRSPASRCRWLMRGGIDHGVEARRPSASIVAGLAGRRWRSCWPTGS